MAHFVQSNFLARRRFTAASLHFLASAAIGGLAGILIFVVWFPSPYATMAGGTTLFLLLVSIDVTLGPVLTAVAASPRKPLPELRRDIVVIVLLQAAALSYGVYSISLGRPVHLAFEVDHFRLLTAANVDAEFLQEAPSELQKLPWTGPTLIAAVKPSGADEQLKSIDLALAGYDLSFIPRNWRSYDSQRAAAWNAAKPLARVVERYPDRAAEIESLAVSSRSSIADMRFLPVISRNDNWIAVIVQPSSTVVGYVPVDGWF